MRFQIDWASLIVGSKFTVFAVFYFVIEGNFPSTSSRGGGGCLYLEGRCNYCYCFAGLIFGGAYFRNFAVFCGNTTLREASHLLACSGVHFTPPPQMSIDNGCVRQGRTHSRRSRSRGSLARHLCGVLLYVMENGNYNNLFLSSKG